MSKENAVSGACKFYHIRDWDSLFENSASSKYAEISWFPIPNRHDGENFSKMMQREHGNAMLGTWLLLTQLASKSKVRGWLVKDNGEAMTFDSMAIKSRSDKKWIEMTLEWLVKETDWIEVFDELPAGVAEWFKKPVASPWVRGGGAKHPKSAPAVAKPEAPVKVVEQGKTVSAAQPKHEEDAYMKPAHAPTWEAVMRWLVMARDCGADYTEAEAKLAFMSFNANGWMWGKNAIADWRSAIETKIQQDRERLAKANEAHAKYSGKLNGNGAPDTRPKQKTPGGVEIPKPVDGESALVLFGVRYTMRTEPRMEHFLSEKDFKSANEKYQNWISKH